MRFLVALVVALLLHACATAPATSPAPQLSSVPAAFEMSARLSIRQADRSDIAKLRWTHRASRDAWVIASPLGNEVARIESDADGATLTQATGGVYHADSFEDLTERALGVPLDPRSLAAWLHGDVRDTPAGWKVTLEETEQAGAVRLARRITAARGDTIVRLVVDEYQPLQE